MAIRRLAIPGVLAVFEPWVDERVVPPGVKIRLEMTLNSLR